MRSVSARVPASALALLLMAGTAAANPIPWFNIGGNTPSRGLYGEATNTTLITPPLPAGGPFTYLEVSGTLTEVVAGTFMEEACIEVSLPSGQQFVVKPFSDVGGASETATGAVTIPISNAFGVGGATLRFFELYRDNAAGPDSNWSNLTFTLHNAAGGDVPPLNTTIAPTPEGPDVSPAYVSWCTKGSPSPAITVPFATSRVAGKVRLRGYGTAISGWNTSRTNSQLNYVGIDITAQRADGTGPVTWTVTPFPVYAASSSQFDVTVDAPVPVLTGPGNDWSFTVSESGTAPIAPGTNFARVWLALQPLRPDAPANTALGTIRSRPALGPVVATAVNSQTVAQAAGSVTWFTFDTLEECSDATGYWLDIHTRLPAGSPVTDTELAMYDNAGNRQALNDDGGSGLMSQLSFGMTTLRPPVDPAGGPSPRNGFSGMLGAGTHYLALSQYNADFRTTGWFVTTNGTDAGNSTVEFRTNLPPAIPPFTDLGTLAGALPAPASVNLVNAGDVKWYRFYIPQPINAVTRYYLDIDTIQLGAPFIDTMLGLYNEDGVVHTVDDDDGGNGNRTQLSYGIGPVNRAPIGSSATGDGRDGDLPPGVYYVGAGGFFTAFSNEWTAAAGGGYTGVFPLNLRHNFPSLGCGPADVGSAGGAPGADGALNNNDFIAFITYFFDHDPHADLGMAGGIVGSDGFYNNNDFIAFITLFFNGCP